MPSHKRGRPKNRRAGCLMCKPQKMNGVKKRAGVSEPGWRFGLRGPWRREVEGHLQEREGLREWDAMSPAERLHGEGHCVVCMELDCFCEADHPAQRAAWAWHPGERPQAANVTPLTATLAELVA